MSFLDSDSSDEEQKRSLLPSALKLKIDWFAFPGFVSNTIGITSLPGCRFRTTWRNLRDDIQQIQGADVKEVFVLCTRGELIKYRAPTLLSAYAEAGIVVHHWPFADGTAPAIDDLLHLLKDLQLVAESGSNFLIHCVSGIGRACLVAACLLLEFDSTINPDESIKRMRRLRGPGAVHTIKQYNFIHEFRQQRDEYLHVGAVEHRRSLSR